MRLLRHQQRPISFSSSLLRFILLLSVPFTCFFIDDCGAAFAPNRQPVLHFNSSTRQGRMIAENNTPWTRQPSYSATEDYKEQLSTLRSSYDVSAMEPGDDNYSSSDSISTKHKPSKEEIFRRRGMALALFMTYLAPMTVK